VPGSVPCPEEGGHVSIHRIEDLKTKDQKQGKVRGSGAEDSAGSRGEFDSKGLMEIQNPIGGKHMEQLFAGLCALALLSLISPLIPVQAQTRAVETRHAEPRFQSVAHFGAQPFFNQ
jgi:hypothetical protein